MHFYAVHAQGGTVHAQGRYTLLTLPWEKHESPKHECPKHDVLETEFPNQTNAQNTSVRNMISQNMIIKQTETILSREVYLELQKAL